MPARVYAQAGECNKLGWNGFPILLCFYSFRSHQFVDLYYTFVIHTAIYPKGHTEYNIAIVNNGYFFKGRAVEQRKLRVKIKF